MVLYFESQGSSINSNVINFWSLSKFEPGTFRSWSRWLTSVPPCFPRDKDQKFAKQKTDRKKIGRTYVTFFMYCKPNMEHTGGYCSHLNNFQLYSPMNQFLPSSHLPPSTDEPKLWNLISLTFTHKSPVFLLSNKPHNAVYYISLSRSCLYVTIIIYVMGRCLTG